MPALLGRSVEWLHAKGLREEGIFRIPSNLTETRKLLHEFHQTGDVNLGEVYDPLLVSGLIKVGVHGGGACVRAVVCAVVRVCLM